MWFKEKLRINKKGLKNNEKIDNNNENKNLTNHFKVF